MAKKLVPYSPFERTAWYALMATVAISPLATTQFPFLRFPLTYTSFAYPQTFIFIVGIATTLVTWSIALWRRETQLVFTRWLIPFGLFAAWAGVATAVGYEPLRSYFGQSTSALSMVGILATVSLIFLCIQLLNSSSRMRELTWAVIGSATVVAVVAVLQQVFNTDLFGIPGVEPWFISRGFSTMGNPDHLGSFLVLPTVLSAVLATSDVEGRERDIAVGCVGVLLMALAGSLTRGAWIAVASAILVGVIVLVRSGNVPRSVRRITFVLGIALAVTALALTAADRNDLRSRFTVPSQAAVSDDEPLGTVNAISSDRLSIWGASVRIVAARPLTGTGPAAYELGWYPNAIDPSSAGGEGAVADDPHSLIMGVMATTGIPGAALLLIGIIGALTTGVRSVLELKRRKRMEGNALHYSAWFFGTVGLQIALVFGAINTPLVMLSFLSWGILLRPVARTTAPEAVDAKRWLPAGLAIGLALTLIGSSIPTLAAEISLAASLYGESADRGHTATTIAPWNLNIQKAYYHRRVAEVDTALSAGSMDAPEQIDTLTAQLSVAGAVQPREYYYPSVRAQVLSHAALRLHDSQYAEDAVRAADDALRIMPQSIATRVNQALALSELGRWNDMARVLKGHWEYELTSPYPGILYAQALAYSGEIEASASIFDQLAARFPADSAVDDARIQTLETTDTPQ